MGGGDIPASGFALYLDRLINLVKPETIVKPAVGKIMIRAESSDVLESAFQLADRLRQAGYIAEIDLDGEKTTARWTIEVGKKTPAFTLVNESGRVNFASIDELLERLEAEGAH
jgi:histidyl-tRNA synthetase